MERVLQTTPGQKERRTPIKKPVNLHRLRGRGEGVWSCLEKIYLTPEGFIINFLDPRPLLLVLADLANEIMYRPRDQNLWSGPVHFLPAVFRSRLEQKSPVTECLVCCVCVLFSMKESMIKIDSWFVSIAMTFYFLALSAARVPLGQCSGVSLL